MDLFLLFFISKHRLNFKTFKLKLELISFNFLIFVVNYENVTLYYTMSFRTYLCPKGIFSLLILNQARAILKE